MLSLEHGKNLFLAVLVLSVAVSLISSAAAVESYNKTFDSYSVGEYPNPWMEWQDCGADNCEGHAKVEDNYYVSSPNSMECEERTEGTRRCFIPADVELRSELSFNYSLDVYPGSDFARISIFENQSGSYNLLEEIDEIEGGDGAKQEYIHNKDLAQHAGKQVLIGMEVSESTSGGEDASVARIDNFELDDGGDSQSPGNLEKTVDDGDLTDALTLGRETNTTFRYDIESDYYDVDTSLVIDSSNSMCDMECDDDDKLPQAKEAAKNYIEATNTSEGDMNSVVEFNESEFTLFGNTYSEGPAAAILQKLTGDKSDAKNAVDSIEDGGGTNISAGIQKGTESLEDGSSSIQAMIFLADGKQDCTVEDCPYYGPYAEEARNKGIEIHGVIYGDGANETGFEVITGADQCWKNSSENQDGDTCWYATEDTIDQVYQSISADLQVQRSANITMYIPDNSLHLSGYDGESDEGDFKEFVREDVDLSEGLHKEVFTWRPLFWDEDDYLVAPGIESGEPGPSFIDFEADDETTLFNYTDIIRRDIREVDFAVENSSVLRNETHTNISLQAVNEGDSITLENIVRLRDKVGNEVDRDLGVLQPGDSDQIKFIFENDEVLVSDQQPLYLQIDPEGFWDDRSTPVPVEKGDTLEVNESNNNKSIGYPPNVVSVKPEELEWEEPFNFTVEAEHFDTSAVSAKFNFTENGTIVNESDDMSKEIEGDKIIFSSQEINPKIQESYYNFTVRMKDSQGAETIVRKNYYLENPEPWALAEDPDDGGLISQFPVNLKAEIKDKNQEELNVTFYNAKNGNFIAEKNNQDEGTIVSSGSWTPSDTSDEFYSWGVNLTDNYTTSSTEFTFRKSSGRLYRSGLSFDTNYSSIVVNEGDQRFVKLEVENNVLSEKNMTLSVSGVNSQFLDGSTEKYRPNFQELSTEEFIVRIRPEEVKDEDLTIAARNNQLGIWTNETIPVNVLENKAQGREVPGIGTLQIIFVLLAATLFYSVRL